MVLGAMLVGAAAMAQTEGTAVGTNGPAVTQAVTPVPAATTVAPAAPAAAPQVPAHTLPVIEAAPAAAPQQVEAEGIDRLKVGTRLIYVTLLDKQRGERVGPGDYVGTFMGSIAKIEEKQDYMPDHLFAQYQLTDLPFSVGVSYDHVTAKTVDSGGGDGDVALRGLIPYIQAGWKNDTQFTPYAELGLAFYQADFNANSWSEGGFRTVKLDDTTGLELAVGVDASLSASWTIDAQLRYVNIQDVKGGYYIGGSKDGDALYTMSYIGYGLGVTYRF